MQFARIIYMDQGNRLVLRKMEDIMQIFLVLALIIALIAVVFTIQNTALVTVTFLVWDLNHSLAFVVLLAILAGVLISQFVAMPTRLKRKLELTNQAKKIKDMETELMSSKVRLEAMKQEVEIYRSKVDPPMDEISVAEISPQPAAKRFINGIKSKLKP
jgi:uncharacterized integral membrane protein